jgi:hypothetical protein
VSSDSIYRQQHHPDINGSRMPFGAIPANMVHDRRYGNMTRQQPARSNEVKGMYYSQSHPSAPQPSYEPVDINVLESWGRMLKLKEMELVVKKHYLPQDARQIIIQARIQAHLEDDSSLDKNLEFLRNIDRARSY